MTSKTYEMFWDCSYCGTQKLLGKTHRHCATCGAPQDPEARYFPSEEEKIAVEDHVFVGADIHCPNCGAPQSAAAQHCAQCGAPMQGGQTVSLAQQPTPTTAQAPVSPPQEKGTKNASGSALKKGLFGCGCLSLLGLVVLAILVSMFWTKTSELVVTGHRWERSITVETLQHVQGEGWCDSVPSGAQPTGRTQRQRGTTRVPDGQDCRTVNRDNGDGTYRQEQQCSPRYREQPRYDTWCTYIHQQWRAQSPIQTRGSGLQPPPMWPAVNVTNCNSVGCTRIGRRVEENVVLFNDTQGNETRECSLELPRWHAMAVGSRWSGDIRVVTGGIDCDSLRAAH